MELNLVAEGFKFMVLGMASVFLFLILMVWILKIQGVLLNKFFPEQTNPASQTATPASQVNDDTNVVAAIGAAITAFRKQNN